MDLTCLNSARQVGCERGREKPKAIQPQDLSKETGQDGGEEGWGVGRGQSLLRMERKGLEGPSQLAEEGGREVLLSWS